MTDADVWSIRRPNLPFAQGEVDLTSRKLRLSSQALVIALRR